jgi:tetratricopeptide (TPR) repeat protein
MGRKNSKHARRAEKRTRTINAQQAISWKKVLGILAGMGTLTGLVVTGLDLINYVREGYQDFLLLSIIVSGIIWLIILWLLFRQRNVYGLLYFAVTLIALAVVWNGWQSYVQTREEKLIVLITQFDGPEQSYGLRNEILVQLNKDFANHSQVEIESVNEVITPESDSGSPRARKLGKDFQADIVIWGWYRPTENPNITVHIENLTKEQSLPLNENVTLRPMTTLADLGTFSFQQQVGQQTSALISFLAAFIEYSAEDYEAATQRFDTALKNLPALSGLIEQQAEIYFYRGNANYAAHNFKDAIQDYDRAIQLNPQLAVAYYKRGLAYAAGLGEYERAIQDFDQAIQIDPQNADAYDDRGLAFRALKKYEKAFQSFNHAIELNPNDARTYANRGLVYFDMNQFEPALKDFDDAIKLDPYNIANHMNRGALYLALEQWEQAIQDYDKAIELDPNYPVGYLMRSQAYEHLGNTTKAEADYKKWKELIGPNP